MRSFHFYFLFFALILLQACATYSTQLRSTEHRWAEQEPPADSSRIHSLFLIGDAGYSPDFGAAPPIYHLGNELKKADKNSSVIFLGDNIYPDGLPHESHPTYDQSVHRLKVQLDILKDFKGRPFFIPGNHEYRGDGTEAVERQEKFIEKYLDRKGVYYPGGGCSGPNKEDLDDDIVVLLIDSQWWLTDWDNTSEMNEGCDAKSRSVFLDMFLDDLKKNRDKTVIVAIHHPLFTSGSHGGQASWKEHLFPLTLINENLYVPMPIVGSVIVHLRSTIGIRQDETYPPLLKLRQELMSRAQNFDNVIFVSGHDHNLQYLEAEDHPMIISGAGSKKSPARASGFAVFTHGGRGFARLDFYRDGSAWVSFFAADTEDVEPRRIYRKKVLQPSEEKQDYDFSEYEEGLESVEVSLYDNPEKKGFHRFLWGELYRDVYGLKIKVPTLDLETIKGGLKPIKRGGGNQTNSLRLVDKDGREYVLRSMQKDAGRIMGGVLRGTFVVDLMRDVFTFSHPYAAFVMPPLADAVGIYHTNPKLYYMAKQPALGKYNDIFGGGLYLFEERPDEDRRDVYSFGRSKNIISTPDARQAMHKDHDFKVDYPFVVRSRLFDMTVGDWDRHSDQWRWATFDAEEDGEKFTLMRPIPRDRDQPFSKFDGLLPNIINKTVPLARQFQSFGPEVPNIKWYNNYARHFDRVFLAGAEWPVWEKEVQHIQASLTDSIIEQAIRQWPEPVFEADGPEIIEKIKGRRDNLMDIARAYYGQLAKIVDVVGTNKDDRFEIERGDGFTKVQVYNPKKNGEKELYFERTFWNKETKEIQVYGLDGDDEFEVDGEARRAIKLRLIGGFDKDEFDDDSKVGGWSKKTLVYDAPDGSKIKDDNEISDRRSNRYIHNEYDYTDRQTNYLIALPSLGYNPDDGLLAGAFADIFRYGFKKIPYAQKHRISGNYAFATGAYSFTYQGEFIDAIGRWDFLTTLDWQAEQYVINFFGLGNETMNPDSSFTFNRVRKGAFYVKPALRYIFRNEGQVQFSPIYESHEVEKTAGRFVATDGAGLSPQAFQEQHFLGGSMRYLYENLDVPAVPTHGFRFEVDAGWKQNLERKNRNYGYVAAEVTFFRKLSNSGSLVWGTHLGSQHNFGTFEFFQAATIGGPEALRGFRQERFAGRTSFYNSNDLRLRLLNEARTYVAPISLGIYGSFDYGRVWQDGEDSKRWHNSYGGGIWFSTLDILTISAGLHHSLEGKRVLVTGGFNF